MKSNRRWAVVAMMVLGWFTSFGQTVEPEVPGDHFSLEGALELFKKSESPQDFEKMLNSPDSKVNNLDLNGDGYIDYIRVLDRYEGEVHAFILQAVVSEHESQDIAVIELEKKSDGKAVLQIVGNEDIYGVTTIIEPTREVRTYAGTRSSTTVVNVWGWPSVRYVYRPSYSVWISPWGWHDYPVWYHHWRPIAYVHYYPIWQPYYAYYTPCHTRRIVYAHEIYRPYRTTSVVVRKRYNDRIMRYRAERRDDERYGRTRDDRRASFVNDDRSGRTSDDVRSNDSDRSRRYSADRDAARPITRDEQRTVSADRNRNTSADDKPEVRNSRPVTIRGNDGTGRKVTPPSDLNRGRSSVNPNEPRRYSTPERRTSTDMQRNRPELKSEPTPRNRPTTVINTPPVRRPITRPSTVDRSRPVTRPGVQQHSAPRQRTVTPPPSRSTHQPASRPSSVERSRPSGSPAVQQHSTPSRSSGATRSSETSRGRR